MGGRRTRRELARLLDSAHEEHVLQVTTTVERLVDLHTSLDAAIDGLPRIGARAVRGHFIDTSRRLTSLIDGLRAELDAGTPEPAYLASQHRGVRALLATHALAALMSFAVGEVNDGVDTHHLGRVFAGVEAVELASAAGDAAGAAYFELHSEFESAAEAVELTPKIRLLLDQVEAKKNDLIHIEGRYKRVQGIHGKTTTVWISLGAQLHDLRVEAEASGEAPPLDELMRMRSAVRAIASAPGSRTSAIELEQALSELISAIESAES